MAGARRCDTGPGENGGEAGRRAGWDVDRRAAEWLRRRLGLAPAEVRGAYSADGGKGESFAVDRTAGGHLVPVDATAGGTALRADFPPA